MEAELRSAWTAAGGYPYATLDGAPAMAAVPYASLDGRGHPSRHERETGETLASALISERNHH